MSDFTYPGTQTGLICPAPIKALYVLEPGREPLLLADGRLNPAEECQRADEALRPMMTCQGHLAALEVLISEARSNEEAYDHKKRPELAGHWQEHGERLASCYGQVRSLWISEEYEKLATPRAEARPDLAHRDGPLGDPSPSDELAELLPLLENLQHVETLRAVLGVCKEAYQRVGKALDKKGDTRRRCACVSLASQIGFLLKGEMDI
ncbi:hypothetical protein [Armatimonas sp.]|uniref:hypothetical protein n=1 Tax=Armatimonas sp. TaxID=1872638 RepID=UPI003750B214